MEPCACVVNRPSGESAALFAYCLCVPSGTARSIRQHSRELVFTRGRDRLTRSTPPTACSMSNPAGARCRRNAPASASDGRGKAIRRSRDSRGVNQRSSKPTNELHRAMTLRPRARGGCVGGEQKGAQVDHSPAAYTSLSRVVAPEMSGWRPSTGGVFTAVNTPGARPFNELPGRSRSFSDGARRCSAWAGRQRPMDRLAVESPTSRTAVTQMSTVHQEGRRCLPR